MNRGFPEKRFAIQSEEFAQEKVRALQDSVAELKQEYPEIICANLYGSLAKGDSKPESDIDAAIFVDADLIRDKEKEEGVSVGKQFDVVFEKTKAEEGIKTTILTPRICLREDLYKKYNKLVQEKVLEKIPHLSEEQVAHMRSLPMSKEGIAKLAQVLVDSKKEEMDFIRRAQDVHVGKMERTELLKTAATLDAHPKKLFRVPWHAPLMFFLNIGGGIKKYRKIFLETLEEGGEEGEIIWKEIVTRLESFEQEKPLYFEGETDVHYPRTLKEAIEVYG